MPRPRFLLALLLVLGLPLTCGLPLRAAINPDHYTRIASDHLRLREIARVVETDRRAEPRWRRLTLVAEVVAVHRSPNRKPGDTLVIDFTVDLAARAEAGAAFAAQPPMPGPQFLYEPDPPELGAGGEFIAYLAPAGGRLGNVNRHAGAQVPIDHATYAGPVYVPVAAQYSFAPVPDSPLP